MRTIKYILLILFISLFSFTIHGDNATYRNPDTGYEIYIIDECDLLSDSEERQLLNDMKPITTYGNAAFVSVYSNTTTILYAQDKYFDLFKNESGSIFVIDMNNRNIWIHSDGDIYKTVTKAYANTIADNTYAYASEGQFYRCAAEVFKQEYTLLEGGKIARPMKHITNAIISMIVGLLANFMFLLISRKKPDSFEKEAVSALNASTLIAAGGATLIASNRYRKETSSSSGSSSSGHSYHSSSSHSSSHSSSSSSSRPSGGGGGHKF